MTGRSVHDEFRDLLDGRIDAASAERLRARIEGDPALAAAFADYARVHEFTAPALAGVPASGLTIERLDDARRAARVRRLRPLIAAAASLLLVAAGAAAWQRFAPRTVVLHAIRMDVETAAGAVEPIPAALATYRPVADGKVNWLASLGDARALAKATARPVFVWVYHAQCPLCIDLDRGALSDVALQAEAAKFVPVRINVVASAADARRFVEEVNEDTWPYFGIETADGRRVADFPGMHDAADLRALLAKDAPGADTALPWDTANELTSSCARAEEARAARRYADAYAGYRAVTDRLSALGPAYDTASRPFRRDAGLGLERLHGEARDAIREAQRLLAGGGEDEEAAGARRLSEASERFRGTPLGLDLAEVEQELRATGRFPVLVEDVK